jgi:hypothetical protein
MTDYLLKRYGRITFDHLFQSVRAAGGGIGYWRFTDVLGGYFKRINL